VKAFIVHSVMTQFYMLVWKDTYNIGLKFMGMIFTLYYLLYHQQMYEFFFKFILTLCRIFADF